MINVFGSKVGQEELEEIKSSLDNQWLGIGQKVERFEKLMAGHVGNEDFVCIDNCSNGLYMAIKILGIAEGSEIIVPSVTWVSCANAVMLAGCRPVFADVDYDTLNVYNDSVEHARTRRTRAVMVVHYAGLPAVISGKLPIIADCAHAVDTFVQFFKEHTHISYFSDIAVFSFDSMKNIACGELGGITSFNKDHTDKARCLRYCGLQKSGLQASTDKPRWWEYELTSPFIKMLPNDISASIGIAQFKKLESLQAVRKKIWGIYQEQFKDIDWLRLPPPIPDYVQHSYFTYFVKVLNGRRDELARYLLNNGIYTTVRYEPLHFYRAFGSRQKLPIAEKLNEQLLNIPLHPNLSDKDVEFIIDKIKKFK